jgi:hypothetical protein
MGFNSIKNWVNEIDGNLAMDKMSNMSKAEHDAWEDLASMGITVLYPGGFKPMTGGHLDLIKRYADNELVKEIRVLVGPSVRDGIDQAKAARIIRKLTENMPKVVVEEVQWPSPVLTAYKIMGEAEPGYYALAASSKGEDYKRVEDFTNKHRKGQKFSREEEGVYVIEMPISADPVLFAGRDDENEGEPISASVLRNDIINDDFDNFVTGYPHSDPEDIQYVWDELAETVMNEGQYNQGATTNPSMGNYSRSQPGYFYRNMHMIADSDEGEPEDISEGGGAGHLMSPWEAMDLSFGEIRQLISDSLGGKLQNVTEKLDGQNIMMTVKNGQVYIARTQKQMKNAGELSMRYDEVGDKMGEKTPDFIRKAFATASNDLQTVITYGGDKELDKVFKGGYRWLNIELLNPETENIVPYGEYQLRIHNIREIDDNGNEIDVIWEGKDMETIIGYIEDAQKDDSLEKIHLIKKTNSVNFEGIKDMQNLQDSIIRSLQNIMDTNHLDDENNLGDYIAQELRTWLTQHVKETEVTDDLVQRWAYDVKTKNIAQLLKGTDPATGKWIKEQDAKIDDMIGELLDPIIEIFSRVGIAVLQNLSGIAASNKDLVSKGIKKKAEDAIDRIKEYVSKTDVKDPEDFEKKVKYLETQLKRIEQAGGLDGIAPVEGVVFEYNGRLFKLTGIYLPVLKMINFFQFGKDK